MESVATTIRTVDSVSSWPARGPALENRFNPHFGHFTQVATCVKRQESGLTHFPPADRDHREPSIQSMGLSHAVVVGNLRRRPR